MPRDGNIPEPVEELSVEELTLKDVDEFFSDVDKWIQGSSGAHDKKYMCLGAAIGHFGRVHFERRGINFMRGSSIEDVAGLKHQNGVAAWNDNTDTTFKDLKEHIRLRIDHYKTIRKHKEELSLEVKRYKEKLALEVKVTA